MTQLRTNKTLEISRELELPACHHERDRPSAALQNAHRWHFIIRLIIIIIFLSAITVFANCVFSSFEMKSTGSAIETLCEVSPVVEESLRHHLLHGGQRRVDADVKPVFEVVACEILLRRDGETKSYSF